MRSLAVIVLLFSTSMLLGQTQQPVLKLSDKHLAKIGNEDNPVLKRMMYLKYFHRDSIQFVKESERYWKVKMDSGQASMSRITKRVENKKATLLDRLETQALTTTAKLINQADSRLRMPEAFELRYSTQQLNQLYLLIDTYQIAVTTDSLEVPLSWKQSMVMPDIPIGTEMISSRFPRRGRLSSKAQSLKQGIQLPGMPSEVKTVTSEINGYKSELAKVKGYAGMSPDSLKAQALAKVQPQLEQRLMEEIGADNLTAMRNPIQSRMEEFKGYGDGLSDSTARKEFFKAKAEEMAMQYVNDNPGILNEVKRKTDWLMKRYGTVVNSNDLSTAVKRTSLSGRTFKERLLVATNFQIINLEPVSIDFAPQIGYRFNSRFALGFGGTYRQTFENTLTFAPDVIGGKLFTSYDIVQSFFAYGEYAQNSPGFMIREGESKRIWKPALMIGVGRRFSVHRKVDMTMTAIYNILHETPDPIYPRAFMLRVGFQLSDIALLKTKPPVKYF